ncbi:MAG: pilus assembly PilX N-terminal domain-containing protein [Syntrophobacter sp.]
MNLMKTVLKDEKGSALILSLLMIALLSVIAVLSARTSTVETRITANDRLHKRAFHQAEAGVQTGKEVIEQNIEDRNWENGSLLRNTRIVHGELFANPALGDAEGDYASDAFRDAYLPARKESGGSVVDTTTSDPHTNIRVGGTRRLSTGSAIQMVAGYEGMGKSAAQGGAWIIYDIRAQRQDSDNTQSRILARWRHVL